jgi:hypothetical protein
MLMSEPRRLLVVEIPEELVLSDRPGLRNHQTILFEGVVVSTKLAHKTEETESLDRMPQQWEVSPCERTVLVAAQNIAALDPAAPIDESVHMVVVTSHVVGAEVDRAVCGLTDAAADVLSDEEERPTTVAELAGGGKTRDSATDDHRFIETLARSAEIAV